MSEGTDLFRLVPADEDDPHRLLMYYGTTLVAMVHADDLPLPDDIYRATTNRNLRDTTKTLHMRAYFELVNENE